MASEWARKKATDLFAWDERGSVRSIDDVAAALDEARAGGEQKSIAKLHDLLSGAYAALDPEEHQELSEELAEVLNCGVEGCGSLVPDGEPGGPCRQYAEDLFEARREGAEERLAQVIASLTDLGLRPEDGGPVYYATYEFGGEVKTVALQPRQIEPVFRAMRDAIGGYEKLQEWRKRLESEAQALGEERERWECYRIISGYLHQFGCTSMSGDQVSTAIALKHRIFERGPMRGPEEPKTWTQEWADVIRTMRGPEEE